MDFELNAHIFCHDLINPPAPDRDVNITLELKNNRFIELTKGVTSSSESVYSLTIRDTQTVGFTTDDKSPFESQFDNLILAFNLVLHRICLSVQSPKFSSFDRRYKVPESVSKSAVIRKDHKVLVNVTGEHLLLSEKAHAALYHKGSTDEPSVIETFQKLQKLNRAAINRNSSKEEYNWKKSLERYERAMYSFERESAFKDLFVSLEKITNIHGRKLEGADFDLKASSLSRVPTSKIETWRNLNNRFKHSARNTKDIDILEEEGLTPTELSDLRKCVQTIIISKI